MAQSLHFRRLAGLGAVILLSLPLGAACGPSSGGATGGHATGGSATGGSATGGSATGGSATGGSATGGSATGGSGTTGVGGAPDGGSEAVPTVISTAPLGGATGVATNAYASATFSEAMNGATLTTSSFTLTSGAGAIPVPGTVTYSAGTATFWPAAHFANGTTYTATITTGATSAASVPLAAKYTWSFTTGSAVGPGLPVDLGTAGNYAVLAKTGISTVPDSTVTGDLGISPAAASYVTGFSLIADSTNVFATSSQVIGKVYAANYAPPTPLTLTTAVGDMQLAFTAAAARAPDVTELGAGNIGGMTLAPGVYKWSTGLLIPTSITLSGGATEVWIFQIADDLTVGDAAIVSLSGGALPKNVFWQVAGLVSLGTTARFQGVVLTQTSITLSTGTTVDGRLLAQTAVTMGGSTVVAPAP
jgi:hypothetical protein